MAVGLDSVLKDHIQSGILSVPVGSRAKFNLSKEFFSKFSIYQGAHNNLPDSNSNYATKEIERFVGNLTGEEILFVLISGRSFFSVKLSIVLYILLWNSNRRWFCTINIPHQRNQLGG